MTILSRWMEEKIRCGWIHPITRRQAFEAMLDEGWEASEAIRALCWYKAVA